MTTLLRQPASPECDRQIAALIRAAWPQAVTLLLTIDLVITLLTSASGIASPSVAAQYEHARLALGAQETR
jgi:hypothetical protein